MIPRGWPVNSMDQKFFFSWFLPKIRHKRNPKNQLDEFEKHHPQMVDLWHWIPVMPRQLIQLTLPLIFFGAECRPMATERCTHIC